MSVETDGKPTPEKIREMKKLYAELGSYKKVAKRLNLDKQTVKSYIEGQANSGPKSKNETRDGEARKPVTQQRTKNISVDQDNEKKDDNNIKAAAYKLYSELKPPLEVAVELRISADDAIKFQDEYWKLTGAYHLNHLQRLVPDIWTYLEVYQRMKALQVTTQQLESYLDNVKELARSEQRVQNAHEEIASLELTVESLKKDIMTKQDLLKKQESDLAKIKDEHSALGEYVSKLEAKKLSIMNYLQKFEDSRTISQMSERADEEALRLLTSEFSKFTKKPSPPLSSLDDADKLNSDG